MIEFTILGTSPGLPQLDKHLSGVYVTTGGKNFLWDCGGGTGRQLLKYNLTHDLLDAIAITHYHPDHASGIFMVLQMLYLQGRTKSLQLFLPERLEAFTDAMHLFYTFEQRLPFDLQILPMEEISQHYPEIKTMLTDHLNGYADFIRNHHLQNQMKSFSLRIDDGDKSLVYTSDLGDVHCIRELLGGCHTVLIDAMHPPLSSLKTLPEYDIQRIVLTHGISTALEALLLEYPDPRFEIAVEGAVYTI